MPAADRLTDEEDGPRVGVGPTAADEDALTVG